jgi:hypothetical protein
MKKIISAASIVTVMLLGGCAGRTPQPVGVVQPQDRYLDCAAIAIEVQANNQKIGDLGGEEGGKVAQNVAAGVVGLFIWPVWFGMDFQGAAGKEVAALPKPAAVSRSPSRAKKLRGTSIDVGGNPNSTYGNPGAGGNSADDNPSAYGNSGTCGSHGTRNNPDTGACANSGIYAGPGGTSGNHDGGGNPGPDTR